MMKQHEANKCIRVNVCFENTMQNGVVWGNPPPPPPGDGV